VSRSAKKARLTASHAAQQERVEQPLFLVHHHPGYLRIQSDAFIAAADDDPVVGAAQSAAEEVGELRAWAPNPRTGSIVIEYEPGTIDPDDLLTRIAKEAGLKGVELASRNKMTREQLVEGFLDTVQDVNKVVGQLTGERADLREIVPIAFAAAGVASFVLNENRGRLPRWDSALYHSYRIFMQWHRHEVRQREKGARHEEISNFSNDESDTSL